MPDGLKGFQPIAPKIAQPPAMIAPAAAEAAQQLSTLSGRLEQFSQAMFQRHAEVVADKAKDDALRDSAAGVPFHKEEVYTIYGKAYNNTLSATYASNAEINISRKAQEYSLQFENDPVGYSQAMDSYVGGLVKNAPTPSLKTVIGIYGKKTSNAGFGRLAIKENKELKEYQVQTFIDSWANAVPQIADMLHKGDIAGASVFIEAKLAQGQVMVDTGLLEASQLVQLSKGSKFTITNETSLKNFDVLLTEGKIDKAAEIIAILKEVNNPEMDMNENKKTYADHLKRMTTYLTQQKALITAQGKTANIALGDGTKIFRAGKYPDNIDELENQKYLASETKRHEYEVAQAVFEETQKIEGLTITEKEDIYDILEGTEEADRIGIEIMAEIGKDLKDLRTMADNEGVGLAVRDGVISAPLNMGVQDGIEGLLQGLNQMEGYTHVLKAKYGEAYINMMSKGDAKSWGDYMNSPKIAVAKKLEVIEAIEVNHPENATLIFNQIGGKNAPTFGFAAALSISGNKKAARVAMLGKGADVIVPSGYTTELKTRLGNAFGGYKSDLFNRYFNGVMDYAKGTVLEGEILGTRDEDYDAIFENSIGRIEKYNDKDTILPQGVTINEFENWLDNIEMPGQPELQEGLQDITDFFGTGDLQLMFYAPGEYMIRARNNGKPIIHMKEDGTPFILKYPKAK